MIGVIDGVTSIPGLIMLFVVLPLIYAYLNYLKIQQYYYNNKSCYTAL